MTSLKQDDIPSDLPIDQLIRRWPEIVRFFNNHRMACVGCAFSTFHTIEDALAIYNIPSIHVLPIVLPSEPYFQSYTTDDHHLNRSKEDPK